MDFDVFRCAVCWETFDGPGELAEHEQTELDRVFEIDCI